MWGSDEGFAPKPVAPAEDCAVCDVREALCAGLRAYTTSVENQAARK